MRLGGLQKAISSHEIKIFKYSSYRMNTPTTIKFYIRKFLFFFKSNRTKARAQMLEEPMGITFWEYGSNKIEKESRTRQG